MAATSNLLAIGMENEIHILDINTLKELSKPESTGDHELFAFSPDGSLFASSNSTGQIYVWKQKDGILSDPQVVVKEAATSMAFSPTNNLLAVGAVDKAYLINLATLEEYARIPHTGTVSSVSFNLDGTTLMTSSLKVVQFWDVTKIQEIKKANIVETACQRLIENFTTDQWKALFENEPYRSLCANLPIP